MVTLLDERYVFPDVGRALADSLEQDLARGTYSSPADPGEFAVRLSDRIRSVSGNGHLSVPFDPQPTDPASPTIQTGATETPEERRVRLSRTNYGLPHAEVLPGNVGYLDIRQFIEPELAKDAANRATAFLKDVEALILDLRRSAGGSPGMVALLASYLFDAGAPVHLFDVYHRPEDRTEEYWTEEELAGGRFPEQPVFILTHSSTFSAGEGLAYVLQQLGRAKVVGETTAGGAHPGRVHRLDRRFVMFLAEARAIGAVTGGNWEGTGVLPDVDVSADEALETAHQLALHVLLESTEDPDRARELQEMIEEGLTTATSPE